MSAHQQHSAMSMVAITTNSPQRDEWEDWEDEDDHKMTTTTSPNHHHHNANANSAVDDTTPVRHPQHRNSVQRPSRIKSKGRQKAQNAKAGIKLVTDMSKFRRPSVAGPKSALASARDEKRGKFSDPAALLALEGEPNSASIGSFSWLKKKQGYSRFNKATKKHGRGPSADLTPTERPIVIGISVPEDNAASHQVSPWTAVLETPANMFGDSHIPGTQHPALPITSPQQLRSVWSPDTEASISPQQDLVHYPGISTTQETGAVQPLPATTRFKQTVEAATADDDDLDTPCTLFEEDGSPLATRKSLKPPVAAISPESAASRSHGWWDHVTTPFSAKSGPFSAKTPLDVTSAVTPIMDEWWNDSKEKIAEVPTSSSAQVQQNDLQQPEKVVPVPASLGVARDTGNTSEKAPMTGNSISSFAAELPPPYSPPKEQVKYGVVLPPSQLFPQQPRVPSRPSTPGLPGTMTSQGSAVLSDVPLTPAVLPDRAPGSLPGDHFLAARGPGNETERQRRRHEKEDVVARKVGGYWRGRGCMPENGCMGRSGREGRQRRRVWLAVIGGVLALIILAIVLGVVLTHKAALAVAPVSSAAPGVPEAPVTTESPVVVVEPPSIFVNATNFPPMPTGVLTVSGPDNSVAFSDCMYQGTPKTSWSCSLPQAEHASVAPFAPNQPEFIFQIQFDNRTQALWNVPDGADPATTGFATSPAPPSYQDMDFLGNTTDGIVEEPMAGVATPFYISLLRSVNDTVGPSVLARRQGFNNQIGSGGDNGTGNSGIADSLPRPKLNPDGTVATPQLFPRPIQQPIRLFDRGLPTEHYGFYTYFNKTIFLNNNTSPSPLDVNGGATLKDANFLIVFSQARFLVQIWTRKSNSTQLLDKTASIYSTGKPGAMPYPVTVTEDMHGGNPNLKIDYYWGLTQDKHVNTTNAKLIIADRGFGGTLINPLATRDPSMGGIDGGTGGCRCEWVNFKK